jgi:O-antigen/teichoic acid export membrane protein
MGLTGALAAPVVVSLTLATVLVTTVWFKHEHVWDKRLAKEMLRFALPFLPSAVFAWALHNVDRYFINQWCSPAAVGIYSLGYKLGFSVSMISEPVMRLWVPYALNAVRTPGAQNRLGEYISYVFAVICSAALAISLFANEAVRLVSSPAYNGAAAVVPVVAAAYAIWGVCSMSDIGIIISKRTGYKPWIFFLACIVNIIGNIIFVPRYGSIAAAWTTLVGMIVFYIAQAYVTRRVYPIGLRPFSMLVTFILGVIAYVGGIGSGIIARVLIVAVYTAAVGAYMLACRRRWQR